MGLWLLSALELEQFFDASEKLWHLKRLRDVIVHSSLETGVLMDFSCVGSQCDYGNVVSCLESVKHWHLNIH